MRLCVFGCQTTGSKVHTFPNPIRFPEQFKAWVELGGEELKGMSVEDIYPRLLVCDKHFTQSHRNRNNRLSALAIPTLHIPNRQTSNAEESQTMESIEDSIIELKDEELVNSDDDCTEVEYIDEDVLLDDSRNSPDDSPNNDLKIDDDIKIDDHLQPGHLKQDEATETKCTFEKDIKLKLDDIDYLFLSYAKTFRLFTKTFQTMLKLDLAKLFARYEKRNTGFTAKESKPLIVPIKPPVKPLLLKQVQKPPVFVPSKKDDKVIYRRVDPLQPVISATHKSTVNSSPQVLQSQIKRPIQTQNKISEDIQMNTSQQFIPLKTVSKLELSAKLGQLKTYVSQKSSDRLQTPATKVMKYCASQKSPAATGKPDTQRSQSNKPFRVTEPDLEMEVSQSDTET